MISRIIRLTVIAALAASAGPALAERFEQLGDYQVHYNALSTGALDPEIARSYDILRSRNRGLLTVSVLKAGKAIPARIQAEAVNLNSQLNRIAMREVQEGEAVYYIGTFPVAHREKLRFRLDIRPRGEDRKHELVFQQRFYTED
jgi:hypothetical protein